LLNRRYAAPMGLLTSEQVKSKLGGLAGWELGDKAISRTFKFADFPEAVAYVVKLAFAAEAADHHPDIDIRYKRVTLTYSTHSEGGLTEKDLAGAEMATKLAGGAD
jgi:4a-hydroxytetrahydrobiopterin dehydratase